MVKRDFHKYSYDGPVKEFDRVITMKWTGSTLAVSEKKARSNLVHQYKKEYGKSPRSKIELVGDVVQID